MFSNAIVKLPSKSLINGITTANLGKPDYYLALKQHEMYVNALIKCGLKVTVLPETEDFPDSVFVEDTAVVTPDWAIVCNPAEQSRNAETTYITPKLSGFFTTVFQITGSMFIEGGDIMLIDKTFYIGISKRTNMSGINQFEKLVNQLGYKVIPVTLNTMLHLKTGVNYLDNNNLLVAGEFISKPEFALFNKLIVPDNEMYAANSLCINGTVLVPYGFPVTLGLIKSCGYPVIELDMSEFRKIDGGLSCLSLRF